jgi:Flp pilus assembly protein TadD
MGSAWCRAQYIRGFALVDLKRFDDAQAGFERLIQFAPQRSRYLNELGYVLQQKRQWQASIDSYNRANAGADLLEPADRDYERCVALRGLGYDLVELGRLDDAEAAYRKCLAITPNEPKSLGEIEYINEQRKKTT